jgi:hypothetical protein
MMSYDEAKDYAMAALKFPDYALEPLIEKANRGFVTWDAHPPTGVNYQTHKFSFLDAIMTGLSFCDTDCTDDWVVLGPAALAVVRTLPQFDEKPEKRSGKMNFVGFFKGIKMYAYPQAARDEYWTGHAAMCCAAKIINAP